jgi:hypothetical protein
LKTASVGGWRAEEVKCRRNDIGREAETKCCCLPLTEANAHAPHDCRKGRAAENDKGKAGATLAMLPCQFPFVGPSGLCQL